MQAEKKLSIMTEQHWRRPGKEATFAQALEAEKEAMHSPDTSTADIITLKVGEMEFEVLRETLCQVEGSLLASQFSGRWEKSMKRIEDGSVAIP